MVRDPLLAAHEIDFAGRSVVKGKQQTCFFFNFKTIHMLLFFSHSALCQLFATPLTAARQAPLSSTISQNLLKFTCIKAVMLSNHLILCCHLLLLPSTFPNIKVFSNDLALHIRRPKYRSFSFIISCSNEYSALLVYWLDFLPVIFSLL